MSKVRRKWINVSYEKVSREPLEEDKIELVRRAWKYLIECEPQVSREELWWEL